jgi:hypothetical protein
MSEINFIGTPAKHGDYYIFHIPNKLIKKHVIDPEETYQISLKPAKKIIKIKGDVGQDAGC